MSMDTQTIIVDLADRRYPIIITDNLLSNIGLLQNYLTNKQLFFVTNETIAPLYLPKLQAICTHKKVDQIILPDGEQFKTLATFEKIIDKLMQGKFDRGVALCALGGGVIGDITGFAAACYRRGVDFIQIPTTLLAQVDASIGGKTAVNHPLGKNMIGAFYQPKAVLIDVSTLETLPEREYRAGLAEVIKYGLIRDKEFFHWIIQFVNEIESRKPDYLISMIKRCCEIKATITVADEHEAGERAILNFGHTFGHAIEAATEYKSWLHGETVAIGMVAASYISLQYKHIRMEEFDSLINLLNQLKLPTVMTQTIHVATLKSYMAQDKKIINEKMKLILLNEIGQAIISEECSEHMIDMALRYIGAI